jgi:hypothetical protein
MDTSIRRSLRLMTTLPRKISVARVSGKAGWTYIARTPGYDRVKVGYWTSDVTRLRSRYVTSYGKDMTLETFYTSDPFGVEKRFKRSFVHHNISCELYDIAHLESYRSFLSDASTTTATTTK